MENYELYIEKQPQYNRLTGCFIKGHMPFNKGIPQELWMDGRKIKRVRKYLELGRIKGNSTMAGHNRKQIVGIKDGILIAYKSSVDAERILRGKGIRINARNINSVCNEKKCKVGKYNYIRRYAGGYRWFFAENTEKYKMLINSR